MDEHLTLVGPDWGLRDGVAARGRAFDSISGREVALTAEYDGADSLESISRITRGLFGFFAVIIQTSDAVYLVCDPARSIPLYYRLSPHYHVYDTGLYNACNGDTENFEPVAESEFLLTRYVTCGDTLHPDIRGVRPGEIVRISRSSPQSAERRQYLAYEPTTTLTGDESVLMAKLGGVLESVFDRAASVIGDRPVAVPLSGGIDSRLVATMLVERGLDVTGFTFGRFGHADVEVSRDVADALGINWEWVEYTPNRWHGWYHSSARRDYEQYAFNYDSLPFLAEWPAVLELLDSGRLSQDTVVCPGHTIATPSERVPEAWLDATPTPNSVVDHVLNQHYNLWEWGNPELRQTFTDRIKAEADLSTVDSGADAAAAYERWEWATRMTSFTNGDLRLYDWFGLDWWLPLWDPEFILFWADVPLEHRWNKTFLRTFTIDRFAQVGGISHEAARRTDRDWSPFDQIRRTFETAPWRAIGDGFHAWLGSQTVPRSGWESWGNYPLAWYGIIRESDADLFAEAKSLYALRTLAATGRLSFDPPAIENLPLTRELDLPLSQT